MRVKHSRASSLEAIANDRDPNPAGATRAVEPVFEEMAREMHMRILVRVAPLLVVPVSGR